LEGASAEVVLGDRHASRSTEVVFWDWYTAEVILAVSVLDEIRNTGGSQVAVVVLGSLEALGCSDAVVVEMARVAQSLVVVCGGVAVTVAQFRNAVIGASAEVVLVGWYASRLAEVVLLHRNAVLSGHAVVIGLVRDASRQAVVVRWLWYALRCSDTVVILLSWLARLEAGLSQKLLAEVGSHCGVPRQKPF
jgi:hypothetical protein